MLYARRSRMRLELGGLFVMPRLMFRSAMPMRCSLLPLSTLLQTLLQHRDEIDDFGRLWRLAGLPCDLLPAGVDFLFDHMQQGFAIIVFIFFGIPLGAHAVDQRRCH